MRLTSSDAGWDLFALFAIREVGPFHGLPAAPRLRANPKTSLPVEPPAHLEAGGQIMLQLRM